MSQTSFSPFTIITCLSTGEIILCTNNACSCSSCCCEVRWKRYDTISLDLSDMWTMSAVNCKMKHNYLISDVDCILNFFCQRKGQPLIWELTPSKKDGNVERYSNDKSYVLYFFSNGNSLEELGCSNPLVMLGVLQDCQYAYIWRVGKLSEW